MDSRIQVTLLRDDLETEERKQMELEQGTTVSELLDSEDISREEVLVSRNGAVISGRHELEDGDEIKVFDVIAGG